MKDIENKENNTFFKEDINDTQKMSDLLKKHKFDAVIHLAAESHVDSSIFGPVSFVRTNVMGTMNLLNAALEIWKEVLVIECSTISVQTKFMQCFY